MEYSLLLFLLVQIAFAAPKMPRCPQPSNETLQSLLTAEKQTNNVQTISRIHFTCLAVRGRDLYESASVIVQYNSSNGDGNEMLHFEVECTMDNEWRLSTWTATTNTSTFNLKTRYDCFECISDSSSHTHGPHHHSHRHHPRLHHDRVIDKEAHCRECNEACHGWGGGHCKSPSTGSCCPYFDSNGDCTQVCPANRTGTKCNECSSLTCYNGGTPDINTCSSCICSPGYTSRLCDTEVCLLSCMNNGTCSISNGTTRCDCTEGFTGPTCEERIPCDSSVCENGGTCTFEGECTCPPGYSGRYCEEVPDGCSEGDDVKCFNGGDCVSTNNGTYYCNCTGTGFNGSKCEEDINECQQDSPCLNQGSCVNTNGSYNCVCTPGYTGINCEEVVDPCACLNGGTCVVFGDGLLRACECPDGWSGDRCEQCDEPDCTPSSTRAVPLEESTQNKGLIVAIVFSVVGVMAIVSLLLVTALLYKRYRRHTDSMKSTSISEMWDGDKVIVNPVYMRPSLLASGSVHVASPQV